MSLPAARNPLRAGGACVRCRKGKTKCYYENGRAPCRNCAKGMHDCFLPSDPVAVGTLHRVSPARHHVRPTRDRMAEAAVVERPCAAAPSTTRHLQANSEKLTSDLVVECERVVNKTLPACVAFHKPSFLQQLKSLTLDPTMVNGLLSAASRSSPALIRRFGAQGGANAAAEHFSTKAINLIMSSLDQPTLADIQALCLLVVHEWGSRNAIRAYVYLGQAARMLQMFRVVSTHQPSEPDQFQQDESFRRTLWLVYVLDCMLTASPGRVPVLSVAEVRGVPLPCQDMNFHFGTPVAVRCMVGQPASSPPDPAPPGDVGEFGHIVLATDAWRSVVEMLTTVTLQTFSEERCRILEQKVELVRHGLPVHLADKPGQIHLHITMGSGQTYAMIHCILHCATIFINRRRLLQHVTADSFSLDAWRRDHASTIVVEAIYASSHSVMSMLAALEAGADAESLLVFPIFMLFAAFTASSTVAYLSLKGLVPPGAVDASFNIVRDGVRLMRDGADAWPLVSPWNRHLTVMAKVLGGTDPSRVSPPQRPASFSVKDEAASQGPNTPPDHHDYEQPPAVRPSDDEPNGSPSPVAHHRHTFTTINGSARDKSASPSPPANSAAANSPESPEPDSAASLNHAAARPPSQESDMTAVELCTAFERQLLELDDLAAFMGGGV